MPVLLAAALTFTPGCFGALGPAYVDVAYVPPNYNTYPSYVYDGANVYLIDGRWYRQDRGHWVYYRSEPRELYRYRTRSHIVVAPPAHGRAYRPPQVYRAPARETRHYRAPARDEHHYRAPARDEHRHRSSERDEHRRHGRD
jgi:hypothetical protein